MSTTPNYVWWLKDNRIGMGKLESGDVKNVDLTGKTIRIHFSKKAPDLSSSSLTSSYAIPEVLHEGLMNRVLEKLSARTGNLAAARYFRAEWQEAIREGKKIANTGKDGSSYNINLHTY